MSDNKIKILKYFGSCEYINITTYTGLTERRNKNDVPKIYMFYIK